MAISLRELARDCLDDERDSLSVRRHIFGYIWDGGRLENRTLSVLDHIRRIRGQSCNLCLFLVGHEPGFPSNAEFTEDDAVVMQTAIDITRELYAQVDYGVRKLYWRYIDTEEMGDYDTVDGAEATDLTRDFSGPNDGIDVFFVSNVTDASGWSNSSGPCNKDGSGRTGVVMELSSNVTFTGILMAHEVGHYLLLRHADDITNVMGDDSDGDGIGSINNTSTNLTDDQGDRMKTSCFTKGTC